MPGMAEGEVMETAGLKKLAEDKRQAVHSQLSQCQLSRDAGHVRENASRGGNKVTLPRDVLEPLPSAGVSFCLALSTDQVALPAASSFKTPQKHYC